MLWQFSDRFISLEERSERPSACLPVSLLSHFSVYASLERRLSLAIRQSLSCKKAIAEIGQEMAASSYGRFLSMRGKYACDWYDFLKDHNIGFGLYKYGWYLNG